MEYSLNYQIFQSNVSLNSYKYVTHEYFSDNWYDPILPNKIKYNYNCPITLQNLANRIANIIITFKTSSMNEITASGIEFKLNIYPTDQTSVTPKVIYDFSKTVQDSIIIPMKFDSNSQFYITLLTEVNPSQLFIININIVNVL